MKCAAEVSFRRVRSPLHTLMYVYILYTGVTLTETCELFSARKYRFLR